MLPERGTDFFTGGISGERDFFYWDYFLGGVKISFMAAFALRKVRWVWGAVGRGWARLGVIWGAVERDMGRG